MSTVTARSSTKHKPVETQSCFVLAEGQLRFWEALPAAKVRFPTCSVAAGTQSSLCLGLRHLFIGVKERVSKELEAKNYSYWYSLEVKERKHFENCVVILSLIAVKWSLVKDTPTMPMACQDHSHSGSLIYWGNRRRIKTTFMSAYLHCLFVDS